MNNLAYGLGYYGTTIFLVVCLIAVVVAAGKWIAKTINRARVARRERKERIEMSWAKTMPIAVLFVSVLLLGLGLFALFVQWSDYSVEAIPHTAVALCGIGLAGLAFVAWLKR